MLRVGRAGPNEPFTRNFATVAQAWADGRVVELEYEAAGGERRAARVRPYFLEPDAAGRSVYLIGHDEAVNAMRTLKVERIRSSTLTADRYEIPADFDPDRWLAHSWGIWSSDTTDVAHVRLRFEASVAGRVRESIWHRSQQLSDLPDGRVELSLDVAGIVEVRPWILSWGDAVEVLEPPELREVVATAVRGAAARYDG
jgi:predicted DNA-binding transcriptional regulator YafY